MTTAADSPEIRFAGFADPWEQRKLGDCGSTFGGLTGKTKEDFGHGKARFVPYTNVFDNPVADVTRLEPVEVDAAQHEIRYGDVFFTVSSETPKEVGMTSVWLAEQRNVYLNSFCFGYRQDGSFNPLYLAYNLRSRAVRDGLVLLAQGISRFNISKRKVMEQFVSLPHIEEQRQIGTFFAQLDSLITLQQRKCDSLKRVKSSMLEKMFPREGEDVPEIRFAGFTDPWMRRRLGNCVQVQRGGSPRPIEDFITDEPDGINWIKIGDVETGARYITHAAEKIKPEGIGKSREVHAGDLILSNSMSFGRPYILKIDGCIHDGWLLIRNDHGLFDLEFLQQLLGSKAMLAQYRSLAAGGVVNNLNCSLVQSAWVVFPSLLEQRKIGAYFADLDNLISLHQRKLDLLKRAKQSLLDKMFV